MNKKCIVMFSGGLDSRLAVKIMQKQKFKITAVFFKLPFTCKCKQNEKEIKDFSKKHKFKLKIFDCTRGKLLQEYLKIIKEAKYGRGAGVNPCIDCKIFMFKKTKQFADKEKINLIVSGEVLGERPMSQTRRALNLIEEKSGLKGRILRPLTDIHKIEGRKREKQISLAEEFKISYPSPAGGCLLCEKELKNRFKTLLERKLSSEEVELTKIGRHFIINKKWVVLGRNEKENKVIEAVGKKMKNSDLIIPRFLGPSAIILSFNDKDNIGVGGRGVVVGKNTKQKVNNLIKAYSKKGSLEQRKMLEEYKL
jgi:predicted subunit of tRNA(5-methylaminomethyl-2-thiouridylate) methyltransferase